jgi:hypothetical protein
MPQRWAAIIIAGEFAASSWMANGAADAGIDAATAARADKPINVPITARIDTSNVLESKARPANAGVSAIGYRLVQSQPASRVLRNRRAIGLPADGQNCSARRDTRGQWL